MNRTQYRYFLKDSIRKKIDFASTDQSRGIPPPPVQKPISENAQTVSLPPFGSWHSLSDIGLLKALVNRQSRRAFANLPISMEELSFLLWATQGVRKHLPPATVLRTVPSAGARHSFETYLIALNVAGLEKGVYRYLSLQHELIPEFTETNLERKAVAAAMGQSFIAKASVIFVWTTLPYRTEWRYDLTAHKAIAIDAGHVCQNLYLACEAIACGTRAVAAYDQEAMDELLRLDGEDEFTIYLAPVGKKR